MVKELLEKMTLEEKVAQMMQICYTQVSKEKAEYYASIGVGSFLHVLGDDAKHLQEIAVSNGQRIPLLFGIDAIHGHCLNRKATIFPTQLSMACSFNPELIEQMASATAREVSADGLHWTFSPVLCLGRDLRWGRVAETFGEDKYLTGELGKAMISGYQGSDLSEEGKILACAKHYIGYGEATGARDSYDTEITYRKMREEFLPPFEKAIEADCATIMTAYGSIDGTPCTSDKKLLRDILKKELGYEGFVVTDFDNVGHLIWDQHVAQNMEEASLLAVEGGNDMMMKTEGFYECAIKLVKEGKLKESLIDEAVERILNIKAQLGLFENPYRSVEKSAIGAKAHQGINAELARESVVLLKNDGVLPINNNERLKISVVGNHADVVRDMYGDWTYFSHPDPNFDTEPQRPYITFQEGMELKKGNCQILNQITQETDLIVFAFGDTIYQTGEGKDRVDLELSDEQKKLFAEIIKTGKPVVSVLIASKPLCISEVAENSNALLTGFNLGSYGGAALAETIFGMNNPSGKLPISFPYHIGQQPTYYNYLPGWHCESYVDAPSSLLYVFGEGLSYSYFVYSDVLFDEENLCLSVIVQNSSDVDGKETVQVYFRDVISSLITPVKRLVAFEKVFLKAGDKTQLEFTFGKEDFSFVNRQEERVTEEGEFEIMVGRSSRDCDLVKTTFSIRLQS